MSIYSMIPILTIAIMMYVQSQIERRDGWDFMLSLGEAGIFLTVMLLLMTFAAFCQLMFSLANFASR